jgi:hypothetical protein
MSDLLQLICEFSEASDEVFSVSAIDPECKDGVEILHALGVLQAGPCPESITCRACDADHTAAVEFDPETQRPFHCCPAVGLVPIDEADLATFRFRPEWLVDWLSKAFSIPSRLRHRALVPNRAWYLGDAACGDTQTTVIFARRVSNQAALDQLASALRPVHPADKGVVITTSLHVVRQVPLPGGYELLPFPEIVRTGQDGLVLDIMRLGSWIQGMNSTTAKGAPTRSGRPSPKARISQIYEVRRGRALQVESGLAEAKAILAEWPRYAPDQKSPGLSTVRRHVARLPKAKASG